MKVRFVWANGDHRMEEVGGTKLPSTWSIFRFPGRALSLDGRTGPFDVGPKRTQFELMHEGDGTPVYKEVVQAVGTRI